MSLPSSLDGAPPSHPDGQRAQANGAAHLVIVGQEEFSEALRGTLRGRRVHTRAVGVGEAQALAANARRWVAMPTRATRLALGKILGVGLPSPYAWSGDGDHTSVLAVRINDLSAALRGDASHVNFLHCTLQGP